MTARPAVRIGLALGVALALRIAFFGGLLGEDDLMYVDAARGVRAFDYEAVPKYMTRHGVVLPLVASMALLGDTERALALVPLVYSLAAVALAGVLGAMLAGPRVGLAAALLLAIVPLDVVAATDLHRDLPLTVWLAASFWAVLRAEVEGARRTAWLLGAGLAFGVAYVTKELALPFAAVLVLRVAWLRRPRDGYGWLALGFVLISLADAAWFGYVTGDPLRRYAPAVLTPYLSEMQRLAVPSHGWLLEFPRMLLDPTHGGFPFFAGLAYLVAVATVWGLRRHDRTVAELTAWWVPLFLVLNFTPIDLTFTRPPFLHVPRMLHPLLIPFVILAAIALTAALGPRWRAAAAAVVALALAGTWASHADYRIWAEPVRAAAREIGRLPVDTAVATDATSRALLRMLLPERRDRIVGFGALPAGAGAVVVLRDPVFLRTEVTWGRPVPRSVQSPPATWTKLADLPRRPRPSVRGTVAAWLGAPAAREPLEVPALWRVPPGELPQEAALR